MSTLKVETMRIDDIRPHPNADTLVLAIIRGWTCVVAKDKYKVGDLVVYFPIDSVLPVALSDRLNVTQYLSKQRVKAAKLRGVVSCGVVMANEGNWPEGEDLTSHYGVVKYEPPLPASLGGQNESPPELFHQYTNIENINKYNRIFVEGEEVVATEKIHGTNWRAALIYDKFYVGSHHNVKRENEKVVYWQAARKYDIERKMRENLGDGVWILYGEVFGPVQDLKYGHAEIQLRLFDVMWNNTYLDYDDFLSVCVKLDLPACPVRYRGPFNKEAINQIAEGPAFEGAHMREGVVIRPVKERWNDWTGRTILKKINPDYLVRRKGTEFH